MAKVKRIIVHCTDEYIDSKRNREYYRHFFFDVKGWKHFGYHAVVYQNGTWEVLQEMPKITTEGGIITNETMAVGAKDFNSDSLQIAYVGGRDRKTGNRIDTRTQEQKNTLWSLIAVWKKAYKVTEVVGHYQLPGVKKACPGFDARKTYANA